MDSGRTLAARLFERHHLTLYRYLHRLTGSEDAAKDLTQEVFLRVVRSGTDYSEAGHEVAWLFTIARNLARDRHRAAQRQVPEVPLDKASHLGSRHPDHASLDLDRALASLSHADREVFLLRDTVGLSYEEIANLTASTVASVRSRLHRARKELAEALSLVPSASRLRRFPR